VIGAARSDIFQSQIQSTDMARYVQRFDLPLLTTDQVAKIVDKRAGRWAQENVQISYEARKRALELSQHPDVQKHFKNPEAALRILDVAYARAMRLASDKDETSNIFQRDHAGKKVWVASPEMAEAAAAEMFHIPLDSLKIWNLNPPPAPPAPLPPPPPPVRSLPIPPPAVPRPMVVRPSTPPPSRASKSAPPAAPARRRKRS